MKVAATQLNSQADVGANLARVEDIVREAKLAGAELVVLPEAFSFLGDEQSKAALAEDLEGDGPVCVSMRELCRNYGIHLVAGGILERSPDPKRPFNTSAVFDPEGQLLARYRKMHLFDVELDDGTRWHESRGTHPGSEPTLADLGDYRLGLSICYDLRFAEMFAWYRKHGANIITVPAAFTRTTGRAHWHVLLRARAIETQCWVVAAAQEGEHPFGRQTYGHAMIVDPWGEVVAERTESGPGFVICDLGLDRVASARKQIPVEAHRRSFR